MKSVKFLEELQKREGLNDTDLAKKLGISQPSVSNIKAGRRIMDEETCLALALALNEEPMKIIAAAGIDRAEKTGQKSLWEVFMLRTQTSIKTGVSALLCLVFVTNFLTSPEAKAAPVLGFQSIENTYSLYYVKSSVSVSPKIFRHIFGNNSGNSSTIYSAHGNSLEKAKSQFLKRLLTSGVFFRPQFFGKFCEKFLHLVSTFWCSESPNSGSEFCRKLVVYPRHLNIGVLSPNPRNFQNRQNR